MQHQHGVSDCGLFIAAACIALVHMSILTHEVGLPYAVSFIKVFGSSPHNHFSYTEYRF